MNTRYKIFFMVELLHEYCSNLQCKDFTIIPSAETLELLRGRQMIYKVVGNKLIVLAKVKTDGADENKLFVDTDPEDKFLFYLDLVRTEFNTVTNYDPDKFKEKKRFYFSNRSDNLTGTELHLTTRLETFETTLTYKPGDLVMKPAGKVIECIKGTQGVFNHNDDTVWHVREGAQYVSAADMIGFTTRTSTFKVAQAKVFVIKIFGLDISTNQYTRQITVEKNLIVSEEDTKDIQVDLSILPAGRYIVEINGVKYDVFVDDAAVYSNMFGVIEIFSHITDPNKFSLLDGDKKVKDKSATEWLQFRILFPNRIAFWKYLTPKHRIVSISGGSGYSFIASPNDPDPAVEKNYFESNKPIPMLETPWQFKMNVDDLANARDPFAPNPDPVTSGMLSRTTTKDYYCTIILNY